MSIQAPHELPMTGTGLNPYVREHQWHLPRLRVPRVRIPRWRAPLMSVSFYPPGPLRLSWPKRWVIAFLVKVLVFWFLTGVLMMHPAFALFTGVVIWARTRKHESRMKGRP